MSGVQKRRMATHAPAEPTEAVAEYLMTIRYMHGEGQPVIAARLAERLGVSAAGRIGGDDDEP